MKLNTLQLKKALNAALFILLMSLVGVTKGYAQDFTVGDLNYSVNDDGVSVTVTGTNLTAGIGESFENGLDWVCIDADGDGYCWISSESFHSGQHCAASASYDNNHGSPLFPDNYLVSGQINFTAYTGIRFYACAQDANFAAEHFGVAVSTTSNIAPADFTTIAEWTMTAKGNGMFKGNRETTSHNSPITPNDKNNNMSKGNGDSREQGTWYEYYVDLSSYAGQTGYVAIRHFNCTNQFMLNIDDVYIGGELSNYSLHIPETVSFENESYIVNAIGDNAFQGCGFYTGDIVIPNSVSTIGDYAFCNCSGFTGSIIIPNSVTTIGERAFYGCSSLTGSLTIGDSVTTIGAAAFSNCENITSIYYNASHCESIGYVEDENWWYFAFYDNASLNEIVIGDNVSSIPIYAFANHGSQNCQLVLGDAVEIIDQRAFYNGIVNYPGLAGNLSLPNSVTEIRGSAFYGCSGLTSVTLSSSLTSIGSSAFRNCSNLIFMTVLAETPPTLSEDVFYDVPKVIPVYVPTGTIEAYQSTFGWNEFTNYYEISGDYDAVSAICNPTEGGSIVGMGNYETGSTCTLTAIANTGYTFVNWTENGNVVSTEATYSFIVEGNRYLVANFAIQSFTITAAANPIEGGTVTVGDRSIRDEYFYGFDDGTLQGWTVIDKNGDGYTWALATDMYNGVEGHGANGSDNFVVGCSYYNYTSLDADDYFVSPQAYALGNSASLSFYHDQLYDIYPDYMEVCVATVANPDASDFIPIWNNGGNRGSSGQDRGNNVSFNNRFDSWVQQTLDLSAYAGQNVWIAFHHRAHDQYAVLIDDITIWDGESIPGSISGMFDYGELCTVTATPNTGYFFLNWTENGSVVSNNANYSFTVTSNRNLNANFIFSQLGEFTYMSPANNYSFTSLPIIFSWDAVLGAQYYDLYLWNADEAMPTEPYVSGLPTGFYRCSSLPNHQTYQWYVKACNPYNTINSSVKAFTLDVEPAINVSMNTIDFGEVAQNHTAITSLNIEGVALEDILQMQLIGEDASMFSYATASGWDDYSGGSIMVSFTPTVPQYEFHATLVVTSGTHTQAIALSGGVSDTYIFNTYVDEDVFAMNTAIPIHGTVTENGNAPVANVDVEIGVFVMGMRRSLQATTDANGVFSAAFDPMPFESGYYTVNSGRIGNNSTVVHDDFNIPGMSVITDGYILCTVTQDQPKTDSILIKNKSNFPLNNIQLTVLSSPEGYAFSFSPLSLGALEEDYLVYTVTGSSLTQGDNYEQVRLEATSSEGAETIITMWYYCKEARGALDVVPGSIVNTMIKGKSKVVDVMLTNNGTDATGNITIDLPEVEWMSVVGNDTLPSLEVNETAYFSLRFSPDDEIPLAPYSGNIVINSERGDAVDLPYTITAVSDSTGTCIIVVTDDYTWNTNNGNGPHLEGAEVTLKGYYSLETVAQGYTDINGIFQVDNLSEGYYRLQVTADHHLQYDNNILVTAGETNHQDIYLQYQAITYSWTMEPMEIVDEYTYELNVVYETNVPAPVVVIEMSSQVPELEYGASYAFNAIITNHGLIEANDFQLIVPNIPGYEITPSLDYISTIPPQSTKIVPVMVTRTSHSNQYTEEDPCGARLGAIMNYVCGRDYEHNSDRYVWHHVYSREIFENTCVLNALADHLPVLPVLNGGSGNGSVVNIDPTLVYYEAGCHPCDNVLKDVIWSLPVLSDFNYAMGSVGGNHLTAYDQVVYWGEKLPYVGRILQLGEFAGNMTAYLHCQWEYAIESRSQYLNLDDFSYVFRLNEDIIEMYKEFYQDTLLYGREGFELLHNLMMPYYSSVTEISESEAETIQSSLNGFDIFVDDIVNRWNQTVAAWNDNVFEPDMNHPGIINKAHLDNIGNDIGELCDYVNSLDYNSFYAMVEDLYDLLDEEINQMSNSVCSSATVQFSQRTTMTCEAFEGTLTIRNGHDTDSMEHIGVNFVIKDENGNDYTNLFQINTLSLNNITNIDGTGAVGAGMEGVAKVQFIPTKQAALTEPKVYYFGGTFSFVDPYTSDELVYDLYPVDIIVHPSPDLYVDYFMQRDILGDDALTLNKVEPSTPAELGVIINNKGASIAKNVSLETAEPKIVDNEIGQAINFALYGASFNGNETQLGLKSIPFGNIESGRTAVGEWLFTSSLLGHFVSYEAHVIHNNSYGNPNISLVSHLDIHELIHPIRVYGNLDDGINDFLVNDVADYYDTPDSIYFSHGGRTAVGLFDYIHFNHYVTQIDTIVRLTVTPSRTGWNYGVVDDPGMDKYELVSCTRNYDNQSIPMNNIWQTFVTLHDASDPIYENKLHFVDTLVSNHQDYTYTLVYRKKQDLLRVEEIIGIPESAFIDYPLESFSVKFSKPIVDSTFTYEDMVLKCNDGSNLMNPMVEITKVNDDLYDVNIAGLTNQTGYYVLNVNTLNIIDTLGYGGYEGKQATWIQALNGDLLVHIDGDQTICDNEEFEPLTSVVVGEYNALQWNHNGQLIEGACNLDYQPSEVGVYSLTVIFENGEVMTSNEVTLVSNPISQIFISDEICEGDNYIMNGFYLIGLSAGVYDETLYLQNEYHCDSLVSLHLEVFETPAVHIQIDTVAGYQFRLTATGADSYEWSTGETTASIIVSPIDTTTYSVVGTNSYGCSDSEEVTLVGDITGLSENQNSVSAIVYPNPAHDKLFIKTSLPVRKLEIFTITGTLVYEQSNNSDTSEIDVEHLSAGLYFVRLITDNEIAIGRFIKE